MHYYLLTYLLFAYVNIYSVVIFAVTFIASFLLFLFFFANVVCVVVDDHVDVVMVIA